MSQDPCGAMHLLLQAELDGELEVISAATLAGHLAGCPACAGLQAELRALSGRARHELNRHAAPPSLRGAVLAQSRPARQPLLQPLRAAWGHGASFAAGMAVAAGLAVFMALPHQGGELPDIVAAHIRALQPGHLVDVDSTDQHTVKPWFDGRLDYAPPVADLAARGFPLVGGRLDYLAGRPVAALVYRHDKHLVDLFVWPGDRPGLDGTVQGYHVISWAQGGMSYRAVSDLATTDLMRLAKMLQGG